MMWDYWISLYTRTHCMARGLRPLTIGAYEATLRQFKRYVDEHLDGKSPNQVHARDVLQYLQHLRVEKDNGDSSVNRTAVVLRSFYRAIVAMGHLEPRDNPMVGFPTIRGVARKLPTVLTNDEMERLLAQPRADSVVGIRDRALLALLYGTGIRVSECSSLKQGGVDLEAMTVTVFGKGGHQRTVPFNEHVAAALQLYQQVRGSALPAAPFFRSRKGRALTRTAIYDRVRVNARRARIGKAVSPHRLRHTFATDLVRAGVGIVTIRDLLGHRLITSTQIYLHVTAQDLRSAADKHPISRLLGTVEHLFSGTRLPFSDRSRRRASG
ncbi:MAG: tyrosine-type recombinase/integrase [Thermoleophilia bacterium]